MTEQLPEPAPVDESADLDLTELADLAFGAADTGLFGTDEHEPDYVDTDEHVEDDLVFLDDDGNEVER